MHPKLYRMLMLAALSILFAALRPQSASASARISLDGAWQFRTDAAGAGEREGWYGKPPGALETVRVPHTWNVGRYDDYEGVAWYFKSFSGAEALAQKHVELHFGATFYNARVWLNGVELGGHEGGHTAYHFDITPHLRAENFLAVEIDNRPTMQTIPGWAMKLHNSGNVWYDWWHYGGVVRDVWLAAGDTALVRRQQLSTTKLEGGDAEIAARIFVESFDGGARPARLLLKVTGPDGALVAAAEKGLTLRPGAQDLAFTLTIAHAQLWHFDHPDLYSARAELQDGAGRRLDLRDDNFGVRTVEVRDRHLYLNGERVRLTGMTRHEESPSEGLAETRGTILRDYDDMKELQVTLTRPVHYPQHEDVLDYCDRHGILLVPEIPVWQFSEKQLSDPKVLALARHMLTEMIEQDFNHPSIFAWSACNESATATAGGRAYFKTMYDLAKSLDPARYVTFADDSVGWAKPEENASSMADFLMVNQYLGSWHGPGSQLPALLHSIDKNYPTKMAIISEFGLAGVFAPNSAAADVLRIGIIRTQLAEFATYDWIGGAIFWCYQDYKSHRNLWPGYQEGYVDHGVVDENRQRRPSFGVWREENAPARLTLGWEQPNPYVAPVGFRLTIEARAATEIPSYMLRGYRVAWEARDEDNSLIGASEKTLPDIGAAQALTESLPARRLKTVTLRVRLYRPTGFVAAEKTLVWHEIKPGGQSLQDMKPGTAPQP